MKLVGSANGRQGAGTLSAFPAATETDKQGHGQMSKLLRGVAAGYGARKLGGGRFSTVIIFRILWWLLGHFGIFR